MQLLIEKLDASIYIINIQIKKTGKKYSKVLTVVFLSGRVMGDYIFLY